VNPSPDQQHPVLTLRKSLHNNGFRPLAVYSPDAVDWANRRREGAGKRPKGNDWTIRARQETPEAAQRVPEADALNTGILCDGLLAVDIDIESSELVSQVVSLAAQHLGNAPSRVRDGSPRCLYLYRASEGEPSKRSIVGTHGKVEVLGFGNQFVAFGTHPEGMPYTWPAGGPDLFQQSQLTAVTPEALQAFLVGAARVIEAEAPTPQDYPKSTSLELPTCDRQRDASERERVYAENALADEIATLEILKPGDGRNAALNSAAHSLGTMVGAGWVDASSVTESLLRAATANGHTSKHGERQTIKTIESGLNAGIEKPRAPMVDEPIPAWVDVSIGNWLAAAKAKLRGPLSLANAQQSMVWPAPLSEDAYIGIPGEFVRLVAPQTEGDPAALLIAFLAAMGTTMGRHAYFCVGPTRHYPNLFAVIVAETSKGRKGTVMDEIERFTKMVDPSMESRLKDGLSSGEGLVEHVRDARRDDVTPIKDGAIPLGSTVDQGVSDKRLLITAGEFGQALQVARREGNTLSTMLRLAWDGKTLQTLARSNKNVCRDPHISIIGNITLEELRLLLTSNDINNGFGNRFLWACAKRSQLLPFGGHVDMNALHNLAMKAAHYINAAQHFGECTWTADGASLWAKCYGSLGESKEGIVGAMSSRSEPQTRRLALIFALLDGSNRIDVPHLKAALEVWRYCQESVEFCFGTSTGNSVGNKILSMLAGAPEGVTLTQISAFFGRNKKRNELQQALDILQSSGKARFEKRNTGGAPAVLWFAI